MRVTSKGERLRVAVLMGGPSAEHEVSLQGGENVVDALSPDVYDVRPVFISREGEWKVPPRRWKLPTRSRTNGDDEGTPAFDAHDVQGWRAYDGPCEALVALKEWGTDVVFPVLHGRFGEDGTVQACLSAAGLAFVGSDTAASATAFDKIRAKEIIGFHGIDTPAFEVVEAGDLERGRAARIEGWIAKLGLPLVLKNPRGGSTLEVKIANDAGEAISAIEELVPPAERLLVEEHVAGRELTVGVIEDRSESPGRHEPRALPVVEIRPKSGTFFDYHEKYAADGAEEICPAPVPDEVAHAAQQIALDVHRLLGLTGLSRTDMILTKDGSLRVLEVNTIPGMSSRGLVPLAAEASGVAFPELVTNLVRSARVPS